MDKRIVENMRVRSTAAKALIELMKEKNFSEISVTDIANKAGIARQSYYRNFSCKEDLIREYMLEIQKNTIIHLKQQNIAFFSPAFIKAILDGLKPYADEMNAIYNSSLANLVLNSINELCEFYFGDMPSNSLARYQLYALSGMIFNIEMKFLQDNAIADTSEIAELIYSFSTKEFIDNEINLLATKEAYQL